MLTYELSKKGSLPAYEFLYRSIRDDIINGRIKAGEKLPPKRGLAEHLGVSVMTIENAYAQLILEGYLRSEQRKGYYACKIEGGPARSEEPLPDPPEEAEEPGWFCDLEANRPVEEQFPFSLWAKLMREVLTERDERLLGAMPGKGMPPLRKAISDYLYRFQGMRAAPSQIIIGAGTEYLYSLLVQLLGRDKLFAVEDPGYPRIREVYRANGARCVPIPLDRQGMSIRSLESASADVAHISPAHHFPTGIVTPATRRRELLYWAEEREGRYIIEDDYDSEFRFAGRPVPTMQSADRIGRVIYVNTFSKTLTPAIRISYLVIPAGLIESFNERLGFYSCTVPSFEQMTLSKFIERGYFESHLARTRHLYRRRRDLMINAITESPLASHCVIKEADSGLHFLLETDSKYPDAELTERAARLGVKISCLSKYYSEPNEAKPGCLVVNYSGVEADKMRELVLRLYRAAIE